MAKGHDKNNERLAFLGDAVLDLFFAELLYKKFPENDEGILSKKRAELVKEESLAKIGTSLKIEEIIQKSGVENHGIQKVIGEAFEAVVGALFLDKGWDDTKQILKSFFGGKDFS